jgi:hypothetical protein
VKEISRTITVVPAQPGWFLATYVEGGCDKTSGEMYDDGIVYDDIIAWEIVRDERQHPQAYGETYVVHDIMPLTVNGPADADSNDWAIKRPNGSFDFVADRIVEDAAAALEVFRKRAAAAAAARKVAKERRAS